MSEEAVTGTGTETPDTEDVLEALRDVVDPELGVNVVDLGLSTASPSAGTAWPPST